MGVCRHITVLLLLPFMTIHLFQFRFAGAARFDFNVQLGMGTCCHYTSRFTMESRESLNTRGKAEGLMAATSHHSEDMMATCFPPRLRSSLPTPTGLPDSSGKNIVCGVLLC